MWELARPEIEPKTPLGHRLREVRRHFGVEKREEFARTLDVSRETLAMYERGENVPTATVLAAYRGLYGISLEWLVTGEGEMFADPAKAPAPSRAVNKQLMHKLARLAREARMEIGGGVHGETITEDAADLYNELLTLVINIDDMEEVEATLPRLRLLFKRKLQEQSRNREDGRNTA